jgi:hypothetical protein
MRSARDDGARVYEVVRVLEIRAASTGASAFSPRFRLEILKSKARPPRYESRLWRVDQYRLRPTFPDVPRTLADEDILVADLAAADGVTGRSAAEVERKALALLRDVFSP